MAKVSIIIPVIRPEKAERCIEAIDKDSGCGLVAAGGIPGGEMMRLVTPGGHFEVLSWEDKDGIGCPKMVEKLVSLSKGEMVCFLGDDTIPQPGFLRSAMDAMATLPDGIGVVGLNTEGGNDHAHWLAHRAMLPMLDGEFFHTGYRHCFCDDELKDRAQELGRWAFAKDAKIIHDHPVNGGEYDSGHDQAYGGGAFEHDRRLYFQRKRARLSGGFKLAIGFPLVDKDVPVQFFLSFACMEKPAEFSLMVPKFPHGPFVGSIADARNSLVEQALMEGCTHLLMADTDQVYPADTLTRLLKHDADVCGVRVHRRWPPFDVIMMRGGLGGYKHVPDEECFSGKLVDVDATGTGCLLFKMEVFDRVPHPWFKLGEHDGKPVGEDIWFCNQARKAGVRICVDTAIEVGHLTTHEIGRGTYELFRRMKNFHWAGEDGPAGHGQGE